MLIGELARRTGVSARMLRHYDSLGLVSPTARSDGGYRKYSHDDIVRIFRVESLRSLGMSLRDVQRALDDPGFTPAGLVGELIQQTEDRLEREKELLTRLRQVDQTDPDTWSDVLGLVQLVRDLGSDHPDRRYRAVLSTADHPPVPAQLLAEALLAEADPNVSGALRWSLARLGGDGVAALAAGVNAPDVEVRRQAVLAITAIPGVEANRLLEQALADADVTVRSRAAIELASRGQIGAVPALIDAVVAGARDVEAGEALSSVAHSGKIAEMITAMLSTALDVSGDPASRSRLTQALSEIPGPAAQMALTSLVDHEDRVVALTARAVLSARGRAKS